MAQPFFAIDHSSADTIVAIATPLGSGAIGIIRISGASCWSIIAPFFQPGKKGSTDNRKPTSNPPPSHRLTYGFMIDPAHNTVIDEVLLVFMKAPHSYTREDVIEIQSHSGPAILNKLILMILEKGARLAEPGEFTKRAFLNGRIDLSRAEAVVDLISAQTEAARHQATMQLCGEMQGRVERWIDFLKQLLVNVEASIEFEDEIDQPIDWIQWKSLITKDVIEPIKIMVQQYGKRHVVRDGLRLDIIGRPNVGKSSLLNRLLLKEKAIVTALPGTTRDLVQDFLSIRGIPIIITDTAGLHQTEDPIETIGIQKTKENLNHANLLLIVIDASDPFNDDDNDLLREIMGKQAILVINKIDLIQDPKAIDIPPQWYNFKMVSLSALTGSGVEELKDKIAEVVLGGLSLSDGDSLIPSLRQKGLLDSALSVLEGMIEEIADPLDYGAVAFNLNGALKALQQITGEGPPDQIMDEIFSRFCIGK